MLTMTVAVWLHPSLPTTQYAMYFRIFYFCRVRQVAAPRAKFAIPSCLVSSMRLFVKFIIVLYWQLNCEWRMVVLLLLICFYERYCSFSLVRRRDNENVVSASHSVHAILFAYNNHPQATPIRFWDAAIKRKITTSGLALAIKLIGWRSDNRILKPMIAVTVLLASLCLSSDRPQHCCWLHT